MERTLIAETPRYVGEKVRLKGWVNMRRDHGKILFLDMRDRSGMVQLVVIPDHEAAYAASRECRNECVIEVIGIAKLRPGAGARTNTTGSIEVEVEELRVLSTAESPLPFEIADGGLEGLHLDTLLNNRAFSLRNRKTQAIFRLYALLLSSYAGALRSRGFLEIKTPKVVSAATEGGANFFRIKYFDRDAFLAQSPQFYKQAGAVVFERVFEVGPVFRAEPHFTTRHVNEYVSLDAEMAFIEDVSDVMDELEGIVYEIFEKMGAEGKEELALWEAVVPEKISIPRLKLTEALQILEREYGKKMEGGEIDIDPEGERMICEYVKKETGSDFVFLTHYPTAIRPFYTMPGKDPQFTESFDLLFRGLELATGGQRIHEYRKLVESIKKRSMNPEDFSGYLDTFRYGAPPHGGWGWGSERTIQQLLGLPTIKQSVLFPRDVKRLTP